MPVRGVRTLKSEPPILAVRVNTEYVTGALVAFRGSIACWRC